MLASLGSTVPREGIWYETSGIVVQRMGKLSEEKTSVCVKTEGHVF